MELMRKIKENAQKLGKRIVLPEGEAERTLRAADQIISENLAEVILVGDEDKIHQSIIEFKLRNMDAAQIIDPQKNEHKAAMIDLLMEIRKEKGLTYNEAHVLASNPLYIGPLMIKMGLADGEVAGAENATGDVLRPAFQVVKTAPGSSVVSGAFLMVLKDSKYGEDGLLVCCRLCSKSRP